LEVLEVTVERPLEENQKLKAKIENEILKNIEEKIKYLTFAELNLLMGLVL